MKNIFYSCLGIFSLISCGISGIRTERIIINKTYVLDSIVLFRNDMRQHKYDSINRHVVVRDTIYFGSENTLLDRIQYDTTSSLSRKQMYRGNKNFYGIYKDSLFIYDSGDINRRAQHIKISYDSSKFELTQVLKGVNLKDKYYFSLIGAWKKD
jgi:hypothetical protein